MRFISSLRGIAIATAALALPSVSHAESVADFYKGKTIELLIGYSGGGGYDVYARLLARHIGKHIPGNPTIVPRNMPGAGSLVLANWLYNVAPEDGTAIGATGRGTPGPTRCSASRLPSSIPPRVPARQHEQRSERVRELAHLRRHQVRRRAAEGNDGRRHRAFGRHRSVPAHRQCCARDQVPPDLRLSRRQRHQLGDGTRRSRRTLRLVVVERDLDPHELVQGEESPRPDAART